MKQDEHLSIHSIDSEYASTDTLPAARAPRESQAFIPSRRGFLFSAAALGASFIAPIRVLAEEGKKEAPASAPVVKAPAALPQRVMLSCTADLAHTQSVTWRAQAPIEKPVAQIALLTSAPVVEKEATTIPATPQTPFKTAEGTDAIHYAALFKDLQPGTQYCYRVGDGSAWSEWNFFQTAEAKPAPFQFIYLGDVQTEIRSMCSRMIRKAFQHAPDARLVLYAGDLVTEGWNDNLWDEFAYATASVSPTVPALPTPGNHDTKTKTPLTYPYGAHPAYHAHFSLPENGPENTPGLKQEAYYVDYQGVRFISINSNALDDKTPKDVQTAQLAWLEKLLANNPNRWTIVTHHHPIYSVGEGRDNEQLRSLLRPLYDKYRVDLVLQGHDHTYGRTHKVAGDKVVGAGEAGTVYAVSVSGAKMYESSAKFAHLMAKTAGHMQLYQVIDVDHDRLRYDAYGLDGKKLDGFQLAKDSAGKTVYTSA